MTIFSRAEITRIKEQALKHASLYDTVMLLDNNFSLNAFGLHQIEFAAAFGAADLIALSDDCIKNLTEFLNRHRHSYVFTALGYDLKNELEVLQSNHPDHIGFPTALAFVPEELVLIDHTGNCLSGESMAFQLLSGSDPVAAKTSSKILMKARVSKQQYLHDVEQIRNHILEGDVYELNYCTEFFNNEAELNPYDTYARLKEKSPVPFGAFLKLSHRFLMCASPERFMTRTQDRVYSQPIKGTSPRSDDEETDLLHQKYLLESEKEKAENLMIVDLVRNDLARTAVTGSVRVDELFGIYSFRQVHQMISTVSAQPSADMNALDIILKAFPMGSMTGAPKIMAMKLIEQYECTRRGLYSGTVGYFTPNGDFDLNVVIRSLQYNAIDKYLSFEVGSAITYDSVAEDEYEECLLKAKAMTEVLKGD